MITRRNLPMAFFALAIVVWATGEIQTAHAQYFKYPPYGAHRGRMVHRDGLFHVERYRWGNGLTPTEGAFLTSAVQQVAPIIGAVAGLRDFESGDSGSREAPTSRSPVQTSSQDEYIAEQQRANALLERTLRLIGDNPESETEKKTDTAGPSQPPQGLPSIDTVLDKLKVKGNPW